MPKHEKTSFAFIRKPLTHAVAATFAGSLAFAVAQAAEDSAKENINTSAESDADGITQARPKEVESSLGSVVVTAQRREENAQEVPTAISVLGGDDLQERGVGRSAGEILNNVPNSSAGTIQNGRPRWWIRGVGAGQQQLDFPNPIGFYIDDVFISNASATGIPIFDLERVEVLRGPQGTLWGKNTTGGAVNIVSKKPTFSDKPEGYVKADYGSFGDKVIQGAIGGTIVDERIAGRISFYNQDLDGRFKNQFNGKTAGAVDDAVIRGQLLFSLTPDLDALLNVYHRKYKTDGNVGTVKSNSATGVFRDGYIPSTDINHVSSNAEDSNEVTQNGISLNVNWQLGKLTLTSITAFANYKQETLSDSDNTPLEIGRGYTDAKSHQWSQEFRLASPREDRWNWLTGFFYFKEDIDSYTAAARLPDGATPQLPGSSQAVSFNSTDLSHKTESYAIFGSTTYSFTDKFDVTLGARWTTEEKEYDLNRLNNGNAASWSDYAQWWNNYNGNYGDVGTFSDSRSKRWNAFTYDITPQFKISDTQRVYFKFSRGIKSGGYNTAAANPLALNTLKPEELNVYEIGYKSEWLDGRLNFNANAFYYDYSNVQVNVVGTNLSVPISYLQNVEKASVKGAEFELEALPTTNLHLNANIGLLKTEFEKFDVQNGGGNYDGNEFVRAPHLTAQVAARYRIPLNNGNQLVLSADARYQGKQYFFVVPQDNDLLNQDPYTLVNARVTYSTQGDKVELTAYVNNLFDKEYRYHALPASNATGNTVYWGNPRTIGASLTFRF
ncbi:iron complex outermembrane recepter protein [Methylobacillus rhizosphaerae]|uniref:Iron complex outermembrane recepter protein n=1 Tax=Methylobacillus rhizosphaerae TaxID=551994 RepID=A0A238ZR23_9PROT|nr:TonB-dependent receptor [Methylobacillus rhizosphaerae]SNR85398.1 iron complex outermembrane recepter protein [Methylobacillus rhizosphaerae]